MKYITGTCSPSAGSLLAVRLYKNSSMCNDHGILNELFNKKKHANIQQSNICFNNLILRALSGHSISCPLGRNWFSGSCIRLKWATVAEFTVVTEVERNKNYWTLELPANYGLWNSPPQTYLGILRKDSLVVYKICNFEFMLQKMWWHDYDLRLTLNLRFNAKMLFYFKVQRDLGLGFRSHDCEVTGLLLFNEYFWLILIQVIVLLVDSNSLGGKGSTDDDFIGAGLKYSLGLWGIFIYIQSFWLRLQKVLIIIILLLQKKSIDL